MSVIRFVTRTVCLMALLATAMQPALARPVIQPPSQTFGIASLTVTPSSHSVPVGGTQAFTAVARNGLGQIMHHVSIHWSTGNRRIATVNANGVVTAVASGSTTVTATALGLSAHASLQSLLHHAVHGVAAQGSAISGATVTLVDSTGKTVGTVTGGDGSYTIDADGYTPPFLLAVQTGPSTFLYSVSADATAGAGSDSVVNLTPLTDLVIRSWYSVQGVDMAAAFAAPATDPPPVPASVAILDTVVVNVTALWLQANGVIDTASFSPISTAFTADGTGEDAVLGETVIDTDTGSITITDGTTTQDSTVSYDPGTSSVTVSTTTTGPGGSTSSTTGTSVAVTGDQQTAIAGILATLQSLSSTVANKGDALTATDISAFLDPNLVNDGLNATQQADMLVTGIRGANVSFSIVLINSLDTVGGTADVSMTVTATEGNQSQTDTAKEFFFKEVDGAWLLSGDDRIAKLNFAAEALTNQGTLTGGSYEVINTGVTAPKGTVTAATLTGENTAALAIFNATPLPKGSTTVDTFDPTPSTMVTVKLDNFFVDSASLSSLVPAGTPFTFSLTPAAGGTVDYHVTSNVFTTDAISITTDFGGDGIANADLGNPLTVNWTLPTTYGIAKILFGGIGYTGNEGDPSTFQCDIQVQDVATNATSGVVTIPATCNGEPVVAASVGVSVVGVDGETSIVIYNFQDP